MTKKLIITLDKDVLKRVDHTLLPFFQKDCPELTRTRFQALIDGGFLELNGHRVLKSNVKAMSGTYELVIDDPMPSYIVPKDIKIEIIYDDEDLIIINKSPYLSVHPGAGNRDHTLVHGLLHQFGDSLSGIGGVQRPGIVHRLDKDTSGLMVVAKNDWAHQKLSAQFEKRTLSRTYIAFVFGVPPIQEGRIETQIRRHPQNRQKMAVCESPHGKLAITLYKVLQSWVIEEKERLIYSKVACKLLTGRTHQIRVHMHHEGYPLIGDPTYGKKTISAVWPHFIRHFPRQALHACEIQFVHPRLKDVMTFVAPLPEDMHALEL